MSLSEASVEGSRLVVLQALRDRLAADIDGTSSARDVAPLAQRLMDVLEQIDDLGGGVQVEKEETGLDRFTQRRLERQSAPKAPRRAKSG